jgi:hypothetical protein
MRGSEFQKQWQDMIIATVQRTIKHVAAAAML